MSKRVILVSVLALSLGLAGEAMAQDQKGPCGHGPMGAHMMMPGGRGMMGAGPGMMGMGCLMRMPGVDVKVEKLDDGVSIKMTSSDPKVAGRIQKRAEIMRLMHELQEEEQ